MNRSYPQTRSSRRSPREHPVPVLHQEAKQLELPAGEPHLGSVNRDRHRVEVGDEVRAAVDRGPRRLAGSLAAPEDGPHARAQLAKAERLRDVVVGAEIESRDPIVLRRLAPSA